MSNPFSQQQPVPDQTIPQRKFCTNCGSPVSGQAVACMSCGARPVGYKKFCRHCGAGLNPEQIICIKCGAGVNATATTQFVSVRTAGSAPPYVPVIGLAGAGVCLLTGIFFLYFALLAFIAREFAYQYMNQAIIFGIVGVCTIFCSAWAALTLIKSNGTIVPVTKTQVTGRIIGIAVMLLFLILGVKMWYLLPTALHWAVKRDDFSSVQSLVNSGANVNRRTGARSPLFHALAKRNVEIAEYLISKGSDVDDTMYEFIFYWASADRIEFLISHGADVNAEYERVGTLLEWAIRCGNTECAKVLVANGADVNAEDKYGRTPLDLAKEKGHTEIVNYLEGVARQR